MNSRRHPSSQVEYSRDSTYYDAAQGGTSRQHHMNLQTAESKPKDLSVGLKPPISLVPPELLRQVAWCMADGAKKRSQYNWRESKVSAMQLLDKALRHILDTIDGQDLTEDSKLSNIASACADLGIYLDAQKNACLVDDRPKLKSK